MATRIYLDGEPHEKLQSIECLQAPSIATRSDRYTVAATEAGTLAMIDMIELRLNNMKV